MCRQRRLLKPRTYEGSVREQPERCTKMLLVGGMVGLERSESERLATVRATCLLRDHLVAAS